MHLMKIQNASRIAKALQQADARPVSDEQSLARKPAPGPGLSVTALPGWLRRLARLERP